MYEYKYPHPAVTTDCVVFGYDGKNLNILLIERGNEPCKGRWAFPGGFLNMDETAEEGALRELKEETNVTDIYIQQLKAYSGVDRDPRERVITIAFYALVHQGLCKVVGGDDAAKAQWFPVKDTPPLAFDHDTILKDAVRFLKRDIHFEADTCGLLDNGFTESELQKIVNLL